MPRYVRHYKAELAACKKHKTLYVAMEGYENIPDGSEAKKLVVEAALEIAQTLAEAMWVYENTLSGSNEQKLAIKKIATFYGWQK